jgi:hypothetical protein
VLSTLVDFALAPGRDAQAAAVLAYLDPGSGSMVLQLAIAGMLSGLYFVRSSLVWIKGWVARRTGR